MCSFRVGRFSCIMVLGTSSDRIFRFDILQKTSMIYTMKEHLKTLSLNIVCICKTADSAEMNLLLFLHLRFSLIHSATIHPEASILFSVVFSCLFIARVHSRLMSLGISSLTYQEFYPAKPSVALSVA